METSRQSDRQPDFDDQQLQFIVQLAQRDAITCSFIENMDSRSIPSLGRTHVVSGIAYRAAEMIAYRQRVKEAREKAFAEAAAKAKERIAMAAKPQEISLKPVPEAKTEPKPEPLPLPLPLPEPVGA
jgi:hypothetical protein